MAMTIDEIAAVVNTAFPDAQSFGAALEMLDARMRVESAQGVQRLAQAQAAQATQQANAAIQAAQAQAAQAQADFDALVAQMVAQG
jgi:hypothetical protein